MKKILCLLLTLVLVFACVSCNKGNNTGNQNDDNTSDTNNDKNDNTTDDGKGDNTTDDGKGDKVENTVEEISDILNSSVPTKITTKVEYIVEGEKTLNSYYITSKDSESGVEKFEFRIERFAKIEEMLPDNVKKIDGIVYKNADGSVKSSSGDAWSAAEAVGYLPEKLALNENYFATYEIDESGNNLFAVVKADEIERVFGVEIAGISNVEVEVETNGKYLQFVTVTYTAASGATVVINTSYEYSAITITDNN